MNAYRELGEAQDAVFRASGNRVEDELADLWLPHDRAIQDAIPSVVEDARLLYDDGNSPVRAAQTAMGRAALTAVIMTGVASFSHTAAATITTGQQAAADLSLNAFITAIRVLAPHFLNRLAPVPPALIEPLFGTVAGGSPISLWLSTGLPQETVAGVLEALQKGLAEGINPRDIASMMHRQSLLPLHRADAVSRTEMTRAWRRAAEANYRQNRDIIRGWTWYTARDDRVCIACAVLDGRKFAVEVSLDPHVNCRCTLLPIIIGVDIPFGETAVEWIDRQPYDVKKGIIGKTKLELLESGQITYQDMQGWKTHSLFGTSPYVRNIDETLAAAAARRASMAADPFPAPPG